MITVEPNFSVSSIGLTTIYLRVIPSALNTFSSSIVETGSSSSLIIATVSSEVVNLIWSSPSLIGFKSPFWSYGSTHDVLSFGSNLSTGYSSVSDSNVNPLKYLLYIWFTSIYNSWSLRILICLGNVA